MSIVFCVAYFPNLLFFIVSCNHLYIKVSFYECVKSHTKLFYFDFALRLDAIPADIVIGFDCSSRSFQVTLVKTLMVAISMKLRRHLLKLREIRSDSWSYNKHQCFGLFVSVFVINSYSFNIYEGLYGIGTTTAYSQDKILNLVTSLDEEPSDESIVSYVQNSIKQIVSQKEIGGDFDPLVFMNYVVSTLDKQQKPRLVTAMIFSSGQIEDSKREEVKNFLVRTSYLPIKWIFVNVGEEKTSSEIATIIKASHGRLLLKMLRCFQ